MSYSSEDSQISCVIESTKVIQRVSTCMTFTHLDTSSIPDFVLCTTTIVQWLFSVFVQISTAIWPGLGWLWRLCHSSPTFVTGPAHCHHHNSKFTIAIITKLILCNTQQTNTLTLSPSHQHTWWEWLYQHTWWEWLQGWWNIEITSCKLKCEKNE